MSWLMRTGTGRNNISWGGSSTTSGNYLKRTGNARNNTVERCVNIFQWYS